MTPIGRAYQEGNMRSHQQQQQLLQRHAGHDQRPGVGDERGFASGGEDSASIANSTASGRTEGTTSASETTGRAGKQPVGVAERENRDQNGERRRKQRNRPRASRAASSEHSEDDDTQASLSSSVVSSVAERSSADGGTTKGEEGNAKKKRESLSKGLGGGRRGSGGGAEHGRPKRGASISAEKGLGAIFDETDGRENFGSSAAPAASGLPFSR